MNFKRILCPIDFSNANQAANDFASLVAESTQGKLIYLHVALPEVAYGAFAHMEVVDDETYELEHLEEVKPSRPGVEFQHFMEHGDPTSHIVKFAEEHDCDLIVMSTHGRTGLSRLVMGSVAESVVRRAKCPVLTVKSEGSATEDG